MNTREISKNPRIAPRIVFDCGMANDPAMMPSTVETNLLAVNADAGLIFIPQKSLPRFYRKPVLRILAMEKPKCG